jgi:hypothetical protein
MEIPSPLTETASGTRVAVGVGVGVGEGKGVGLAGTRFSLPGTEQALRARMRRRLTLAKRRGDGWKFIFRIIPIK